MKVLLCLLVGIFLRGFAAAQPTSRLWLMETEGSSGDAYSLPAGCTEYLLPCTGKSIWTCTQSRQEQELGSRAAIPLADDSAEVYILTLGHSFSVRLLTSWGVQLLVPPIQPNACQERKAGIGFAIAGVQDQKAVLEPLLRSQALHKATKVTDFPHKPRAFAPDFRRKPEDTVPLGLIEEIVSRVDKAEYRLRLEELSGERSFMLDGREITTKTRYTFAQPHIHNAQYARNLFLQLYGADEADLQTFTLSGTQTQNVVAVKLGVESPDRIFVVGAHYDSTSEQASTLAPGAVDNGSGAAGVLAIAQALEPYKFKSTIHFVLFGGEEQGIHGSAFYVREAQSKGLNIVNALTMDMIGYSNRYFGVKVEGTRNQAISDLMDAYVDEVKRISPDLTISLSYNSFGSDHVSFQRAGIPAILAIEQDDTNYPGYHRTTDTMAYVNLDQAVDISKALAALLARQAGVVESR